MHAAHSRRTRRRRWYLRAKGGPGAVAVPHEHRVLGGVGEQANLELQRATRQQTTKSDSVQCGGHAASCRALTSAGMSSFTVNTARKHPCCFCCKEQGRERKEKQKQGDATSSSGQHTTEGKALTCAVRSQGLLAWYRSTISSITADRHEGGRHRGGEM